MRIIFYSGDTDGAIGTYGSKQWIKELGWKVTKSWTQWKLSPTDDKVRGYYERRDGMDFLTIHGVGHLAPEWAREPTNRILTDWVRQEGEFAK